MSGTSEKDPKRETLDQLSSHGSGNLLVEYWNFLRDNRKWYLIPIVIALLLLGMLVFVAGSSAAPFIYTMF